jgi:hypothetical protein
MDHAGGKSMTQLLKEAFAKASKLPNVEQNSLARWVLEEIASETRWEKTFAESEPVLSRLAREAMKEHRSGRTLKLDPDRL